MTFSTSRQLCLLSAWVVLAMAACGDDDCTPTTCEAAGADCGEMPDGCGASLTCGSCSGTDICGGGGANVCGANACSPTSCAAEGFDCGLASNNCDGVLECGTCSRPEICGAGGPNRCAVPPSLSGMCSEDCLRETGGECCLECGCQQISCVPLCSDGFFWDCEQQCCFSSDLGRCQ